MTLYSTLLHWYNQPRAIPGLYPVCFPLLMLLKETLFSDCKVLVSTEAAGMGVDIKGVSMAVLIGRNVIMAHIFSYDIFSLKNKT